MLSVYQLPVPCPWAPDDLMSPRQTKAVIEGAIQPPTLASLAAVSVSVELPTHPEVSACERCLSVDLG